MAIKSIDEIMDAVRTRMGDDISDETLMFIEDVSDTLNSFSEADNWRKRYEENDEEWRRKYRDRFFSSKDEVEGEDDFREREEEKESLTYENLFKED